MHLDKVLNTAFSFGAAIVIFGAWAKIETLEFGNIALTAGLLTETLIFCCYGFLEWSKKPGEREVHPAPHKENIEELTDSIRQTARLLNKIFRV